MQKNNNTTAYRDSLRLKILSTALSLFKQKGIKAVKMDDIATEMSISKRTLYEIYSNKEDLLYECVKYDAEETRKTNEAYAEIAKNEMDLMAFSLRLKLKDLESINPLFFTEVHKYSRIVEFLKEDKLRQHEKSRKFMKKGIENGFLRNDINYDILDKLGDAAMNCVMQEKLYIDFSLFDIFRTFTFIFLRGCCTEKGLRYIEKSFRDSIIGEIDTDKQQ
ncbi:MAG: TetR/AcrR family transcriptional regulator [Prevotellaceae bacterium]|nr:TetR/AcrR family transcriptional regulator [Prevotellaceae bacterium]